MMRTKRIIQEVVKARTVHLLLNSLRFFVFCRLNALSSLFMVLCGFDFSSIFSISF